MNYIPIQLPGFEIEHVLEEPDRLTIRAKAITSSGSCPDCQQTSRSIHSYYGRRVRDLPSSGREVWLVLQVRRFRCVNQACARVTFAERWTGLIAKNGQRTERITETLCHLAFALGGEGGRKVLPHLKMNYSADTLLRLIRGTPDVADRKVRVVGIDDWAFRKGHNYGTILVDLERRQVVDLLPNREPQTVANWLKAHPEVEIISRDRSSAYAEGARLGAPQAMEVADRWHLLRNLWEALAAAYDVHYPLLQSISFPPQADKSVPSLSDEPSPQPHLPLLKKKRKQKPNPKQEAREQKRTYWLGKFEEVKQLKAQGLSIQAIARQTHLCTRTVRKYVRLGELPRKTSPKPGTRLITPYLDYVRQRLLEGQASSRQLLQELRPKGFSGGKSTVHKCIVQLQHELGLKTNKSLPSPRLTAKGSPLTARLLASLVLCQPHSLTEVQQKLCQQAASLHTQIAQASQLAQEFAYLLRTHQAEQLDRWREAVNMSKIPSLIGFASGLQQDDLAVKNAFTFPYSNGQVEGQVNRLKLLKRQMYGRAKFDLLRSRVLYH